ncbi:MAG: hypothetical protein H2169_06605 [Opitutus sp.]|nr:hypothetical protein [Opitutus sp.]
MKLKLRLIVDVEYDIDAENPEAEVPLLSSRLEDVVKEGFGNGVITDDLCAVVEDYSTKVERIPLNQYVKEVGALAQLRSVTPFITPREEQDPLGVFKFEPLSASLTTRMDATDDEEIIEAIHMDNQDARSYIEQAVRSHAELIDVLGRVTQFMENAVTDSHEENRLFYSELAHGALARAGDRLANSLTSKPDVPH